MALANAGMGPTHYIRRPDGAISPMLAMDDFPQGFVVQNIPRYLTTDQLDGLVPCGIMPTRMQPLTVAGPQPAAAFVNDQDISELAALLNEVTFENIPERLKKSITSLLDRPGGLHKVIYDMIAAASAPPMTEKQRQEVSSDPPSPSSNPGCSTPPTPTNQQDQSKKLCSYWIRKGECGFTQVGCKFRHEMPLDAAGLAKEGLRDIPEWYRLAHGIPKNSLRIQQDLITYPSEQLPVRGLIEYNVSDRDSTADTNPPQETSSTDVQPARLQIEYPMPGQEEASEPNPPQGNPPEGNHPQDSHPSRGPFTSSRGCDRGGRNNRSRGWQHGLGHGGHSTRGNDDHQSPAFSQPRVPAQAPPAVPRVPPTPGIYHAVPPMASPEGSVTASNPPVFITHNLETGSGETREGDYPPPRLPVGPLEFDSDTHRALHQSVMNPEADVRNPGLTQAMANLHTSDPLLGVDMMDTRQFFRTPWQYNHPQAAGNDTTEGQPSTLRQLVAESEPIDPTEVLEDWGPIGGPVIRPSTRRGARNDDKVAAHRNAVAQWHNQVSNEWTQFTDNGGVTDYYTWRLQRGWADYPSAQGETYEQAAGASLLAPNTERDRWMAAHRAFLEVARAEGGDLKMGRPRGF
ncbi:Zinc finger CCCH-type [Penicillium argentinense]|uniref:Zinc finger CCCH-type n=1 Tax=Penicillium argentinense TaxID=1131581 RepID=A0A9W9EJ51_9EURO|nr:Zinc finger CCCH-type [Penicillium argentinense]KAJ5082803.1 Zinc finger CCCH-type [Penicillium argentinense]